VVGADCTKEPQAVAARLTEIPTNASLMRDQISPVVEISASLSRSDVRLRWALLTSRLTLALDAKFPILRADDRRSVWLFRPEYRYATIRPQAAI
jgi:hypothetical protein